MTWIKGGHMPRIAALSDDLSSDFRDAARLAVDLGIDGLAIRHVDGVRVEELSDKSLARVRDIAADSGLTIATLTSQFGRDFFVDEAGRSEGAVTDAAALEMLDRVLEAANLLGTPLVRCFAPWLRGRDGLGQWWERPAAGDVPGPVADRVAEYAARAEKAGLTMIIELEGASYVGQVAEARSLFEQIDSPALALCWDVCNGWWSGELPWEEGWPLARGLPIADVQTKDVRARPGDPARPLLDQVVLGEGDLPYDRIVAALLADGYEGWFTAERVYHPRRPEVEPALRSAMLADLRALRELVQR